MSDVFVRYRPLEMDKMVHRTLCAMVLVVVAGCATSSTTVEVPIAVISSAEPFVDPRDGRSYETVMIGSQRWMARNIAFPTVPSWCYRDEAGDCEANGRLYSWEKAHEACPGRWHVPTDDEWMLLEQGLGISGKEVDALGFRGTIEGARLRRGGDTGFDAPISGYRRPDGSYARRGQRSAYWTITAADDSAAWHRDIRSDDDRIYRSSVPKSYALSLRCVAD